MLALFRLTPVLLLVACSTFRPDAENIKPTPDERLLAYQAPLDQGGRLVINRDMGLMGGGCYLALAVDRQVAARIGMGERVVFHVPSGVRVLGMLTDEQDDTLCGMGNLHKELAVSVAPGSVQYFQIHIDGLSGFAMDLDVEPPAMSETQ